jgi:hypothetical protein
MRSPRANMPGFDKHVVRVAAAMAAGGTEVSALRGALRGAVHRQTLQLSDQRCATLQVKSSAAAFRSLTF